MVHSANRFRVAVEGPDLQTAPGDISDANATMATAIRAVKGWRAPEVFARPAEQADAGITTS
jgi:hypothetical protein